MNKSRLLVVLMVMMIFPSMLFAKDLDKFMLRAYIFDVDYNPIDSVTVTIMQNDTVKVPFKLLVGDDATGMIKGNQLRAMVNSGMGKYKLMLYKEGYELKVREFEIASVSEDIKYLPAIQLIKEETLSRDLDEVTVEATKIKMVMKGDTIVYDASAFNLSEGSMLEALVRQLPNAKLDAEGVITVNGRKINELLINGKDFFKGDPEVALKNLPSYTVKNIKVYDKEADNAYLTHSNAKLETREEDQNMVMDVVLKKEYNNGYMANISAGYGTSDRYQGRAFGMGYNDKLRITAFANVNNVGNTSRANAEGHWRGGWSESGVLDLAMGGIDYSYEDKDKESERLKLRASGNTTFSHERVTSHNIAASTNFYPTGDLYTRSVTHQREIKKHLISENYVQYNGSNFFLSVSPNVDWLIRDRWYNSYNATLSQNPYEAYRGEAVDSLFSSRGDFTQYYKHLLTKMHHMSRSNPGWINTRINTNMTLRPKTWKGSLRGWLSGSYNRSSGDDRTLMVQSYGPDNKNNTTPVNRDQWNPNSNTTKNMSVGASYSQDFRKFGEVRTNTFTMEYSVTYNYDYSNNASRLFLGTDSIVDSNMLPSLIEPAHMILDMLNTSRSRETGQTVNVSSSFGYSSEPTAPSDYGFNPTYRFGVRLMDNIDIKKLEYFKPEQTAQSLSQTRNKFSPNVFFNLGSTNKNYNAYLNLSYSYTRTAPSLWLELQGRTSTNPLVVYLSADNLKDPGSHTASLNFHRWGRGEHHPSLGGYMSWIVSCNSISSARKYNPYTGVSTYIPMNVNGNWRSYSQLYYSIQVGRNNCFNLNGGLNFQYSNSTDYVTLETEPERSSVRSIGITPSADVSYQLPGDRGTIGVNGSVYFNNARSERKNFIPIDSRDYNVGVRGDIKLPWDMQLASSLRLRMRRNYSDNSMNTTEWLWNASIEKTVLKKKLMIRLEAVDILDSVKDIFVFVNSQGRYETWQNSLPRYVMLSLNYRFDMKPRNKR